MIEDIIVLAIVAAVVLVGLRSFLRTVSGRDGGSGCGGCRANGDFTANNTGCAGKCPGKAGGADEEQPQRHD